MNKRVRIFTLGGLFCLGMSILGFVVDERAGGNSFLAAAALLFVIALAEPTDAR